MGNVAAGPVSPGGDSRAVWKHTQLHVLPGATFLHCFSKRSLVAGQFGQEQVDGVWGAGSEQQRRCTEPDKALMLPT